MLQRFGNEYVMWVWIHIWYNQIICRFLVYIEGFIAAYSKILFLYDKANERFMWVDPSSPFLLRKDKQELNIIIWAITYTGSALEQEHPRKIYRTVNIKMKGKAKCSRPLSNVVGALELRVSVNHLTISELWFSKKFLLMPTRVCCLPQNHMHQQYVQPMQSTESENKFQVAILWLILWHAHRKSHTKLIQNNEGKRQ